MKFGVGVFALLVPVAVSSRFRLAGYTLLSVVSFVTVLTTLSLAWPANQPALGEEAPEAIVALLGTLLRHRRGDQLGGIAAVYGALADEAAGVIRAEVTTVVPLTAEHRARLVSVLSRMTGRRAELEERIDEGIVAGAQIRLGDRLIDGSAAGRIERMRAHLMRAQG